MRRLTLILPFLSLACSNLLQQPQTLICADLHSWIVDIPAQDQNPNTPSPFRFEHGCLITDGTPEGHLISKDSFRDYRLIVEYRWPGEPGNCGVLVHGSTPRRLYGMYPQSIECQMHAGNAGDFWCIGEDIWVPNMEARRGPKEEWGIDGQKRRRILNLTDGSEKPAGEWNQMVIEACGRTIDIWVNGELVNHGEHCTATHGRIAIQAEGAPCEFRRIEIQPRNPRPSIPQS